MKTEKFQQRGDNSASAEAFQLLRGRAPAQLTGNTGVDGQLLQRILKFKHGLDPYNSQWSTRRALMNAVMNLPVPQNAANFLLSSILCRKPTVRQES
jgi:hypothetical protein